MMHDVHAHIATPATAGLDAAHAASPACDVAGDHAGTVWYTVVDFIRAVVEARATARPTHPPGTRGDGISRTKNRPVPHH
jgi:hypothetical protein